MKAWSEIEIQLALFKWLERRSRILIFPNFTPYKWHECDMFSITGSLYFHEIEVKISQSDFYAEKNKRLKHRALSGDLNVYAKLLPRTFCYACPDGLLNPTVMPRYAGLIWVSRVKPDWENHWTGYRVVVVKKPPVLTSRKMVSEQIFKIANNLWWRYAQTWKKMAEAKIIA